MLLPEPARLEEPSYLPIPERWMWPWKEGSKVLLDCTAVYSWWLSLAPAPQLLPRTLPGTTQDGAGVEGALAPWHKQLPL